MNAPKMAAALKMLLALPSGMLWHVLRLLTNRRASTGSARSASSTVSSVTASVRCSMLPHAFPNDKEPMLVEPLWCWWTWSSSNYYNHHKTIPAPAAAAAPPPPPPRPPPPPLRLVTTPTRTTTATAPRVPACRPRGHQSCFCQLKCHKATSILQGLGLTV